MISLNRKWSNRVWFKIGQKGGRKKAYPPLYGTEPDTQETGGCRLTSCRIENIRGVCYWFIIPFITNRQENQRKL